MIRMKNVSIDLKPKISISKNIIKIYQMKSNLISFLIRISTSLIYALSMHYKCTCGKDKNSIIEIIFNQISYQIIISFSFLS